MSFEEGEGERVRDGIVDVLSREDVKFSVFGKEVRWG